MASYPPPGAPDPRYRPPYGPGSTYIPSPREQRRAARLQQDLYRAQTRAQMRAQMRAQSHALRRSSIVGPLLILALGGVLLLIRTGTLSTSVASDWFSHWWPLLFVAVGLVRLGEWGLDQRAASAGVPLPRRCTGAGVITLLILTAIFGSVLQSFGTDRRDFAQHLGLNPMNLEEFLGEKHTSEQQLDIGLAPGDHLTLTNPHGDITVTGQSGDGRMHLTLSKTVYSWSQSEASQRAGELNPQVQTATGSTTITIPNQDGARVDITATVPQSTLVTLSADHGDVDVSGLNAPLTVTAQHGDVELSRIAAAVTARTGSSGATFSAHDITGDLILKGHAQDVNLASITGATAVEGEFFGDTHLEHIAGPVSFDSTRTHFRTGRLDGELDMSPGSTLTATQLSGATTLRTRSRNIDFTGITGDINIANSNGSVHLTSLAPLGNILVDNRNGAVTLNLPAHPGIALTAQTQDGKIDNNLELTPHASGSTVQLNGQLGDAKSQVTLKTTHADITIQTGSASTSKDDQ